MPDEHSNLNSPSAPRRSPSGRRRGRRGGRGRVRSAAPRPATGENLPPSDDTAPGMETSATGAPPHEAHDAHEAEPDTSGGFREPHPEEPTLTEADNFSEPESMTEGIPDAGPDADADQEPLSTPQPQRAERSEPPVQRERPERPERPERRPEPIRQKAWSRPADFRPADISAIHQAVLHATEIAESLKHTMDQLEEILELVELAERQKLADEREIDELHRALRRIQPPRHMSSPPQQQEYSRGPRRDEPRRDQPRRDEPRRDDSRRNEPARAHQPYHQSPPPEAPQRSEEPRRSEPESSPENNPPGE